MMKLLLALASITLLAVTSATAGTVTCKPDTSQWGTVRCSDGTVWKQERYGFQTFRSNRGETCKQDRYGGAVRCTSP